ncbi:glycoprotein hormones alpha chain precursor [Cynoglossus semilaevis]|nr:glycoprotein hormones alpha chain precursor [Cynoglossus semilaevis]AFD04550.1 gonadotropin common alpha subunit [Cynoglossus semilaevis]
MEGKATAASTMGSVKSATLSLLLLTFSLYVADSYHSKDLQKLGCESCTLGKNDLFSLYGPVYQCQGCCFSRAFPTPLTTLETMESRKNITSEATCCVARSSYEVVVAGIVVRNHTDCHCSTCKYHKI